MKLTVKNQLVAAMALTLLSPCLWAADASSGDQKLKDDALKAQFPLSPDDIKRIRELDGQVERALTENESPSDIRTTVRTLDMTDGKPKQITLAANFVTTVIFVGESGAPWPVEKVLTGNREIVATPEQPVRNTSVDLTVLTPYMFTNVMVYLVGRAEPVTMYIKTIADPEGAGRAR